MQIEKRIGREKKRCGYAPFNSAQQAIKLRSLRSLRPSGKLPSATCFIAGPLTAMPRRAAPQRSTLNDNGFYPEYAVGFLLRPEIAVLRQAQHRLASASLGFLSSE